MEDRHLRWWRDEAESTQVAAESSGGGTGCWVLVDATHREGIAGVVAIDALAPDEIDGRQVEIEHEPLQAVELVLQRSQPAPRARGKYQMARSRIRDARRQRGVELFRSPAQRAERLADDFGRGLLDVRPDARQRGSRRARGELYPEVVDAREEEGGVPSRLLKTDAGDGRREGTPCQMFAGSLSGRTTRPVSRSMSSRGRALAG
ncbi:MAG TPA: hypothetical protein VFT22_16990 [Kofleriaceae bacterium]|nr:hypothetical protein [Kofleriaceae bacterium]